MAFVEIENLTYYYPGRDIPSLEDINLQINEGEFVLLIGPSACGKSTLLRALAGLVPDFYGGRIGGSVRYRNTPLKKWDKKNLAKEVGIILQDPEKQIVMTGVEQEIAFGLENVNIPQQEMRRRIAEVLALFGLSGNRRESTFNLSAGQKQKVVLASVLAMHPRVLLMDEPTSQLDPMAAQELLNYVHKLNLEWGLTVVLVEQRMDRCFHLADRVIFMDKGKVVNQGSPYKVVKWAAQRQPLYIPPVSRLFAGWDTKHIPLTIKEGRTMLNEAGFKIPEGKQLLTQNMQNRDEGMEKLKVSNLYATYNKRDFALKKVNISLLKGSITVILGENGAGKSTLLKTISGLLKPVKGKVYYKGEDITGLKPEQIADDIGYLSQNPNDYLFNDTVEEEVSFNLKIRGRRDKQRVESILKLLGLAGNNKANPRDLSGGERQRVALGTVLATQPGVLLLDEPTRGLDAGLKHQLMKILNVLKKQGASVLLVTHDVEFAAEISDRVIIISDGEMVAEGDRREILTNSLYYAPQVNRLFKGMNDRILSMEEALQYTVIKSQGNKK